MQLSWTRLPFTYRTTADYEHELTAYISQAFYERLPAAGYEVREEQIFTSFRIARALVAGETLLAEAAAGTGKTFAYLVPAVCHARRTGRPVVVACATDELEMQLVGAGGDAAVLSRLLGLEIDARPARQPQHTVCEVKLNLLRTGGVRRRGLSRLLRWAESSPHGERREIPDIPDEMWELAAWDPSLGCDTCKHRGTCHLARAREFYRQSTDLVVCGHALFLRDLWTRRQRQEAGLRPLLPSYSAVIFDEGHRIPDVVRRTAGQSLHPEILRRSLAQVLPVSKRVGFLRAHAAVAAAGKTLWAAATAAVTPGDAERLAVTRSDWLLQSVAALQSAIEGLQDELAVEEAMSEGTEEEVRLLALQDRLDGLVAALVGLQAPAEQTVVWATPGEDGPSLFVAPRQVGAQLQELYRQRLPVIFTSATLAGEGDFSWIKQVLGAPGAQHSRAETPFHLARQVLVYLPLSAPDPVVRLVDLLHASDGRALVLLPSRRELLQLRTALHGHKLPWPLLWEGDAERSALIRQFAADETSVLVGTSLWEGIDVPGSALSVVVVPHLPFPPDDPVLAAHRQDAAAAGQDPFAVVDVSAMATRLKQGWGRLVRSAQDRGVLALLDTSFLDSSYEQAVKTAFPDGAQITGEVKEVRAFLRGALSAPNPTVR